MLNFLLVPTTLFELYCILLVDFEKGTIRQFYDGANVIQRTYKNLFVQSSRDVGYINAYISLLLLGPS